jgi:hypothetical protein
MKYAVETGSGAMIYIPSFMKTGKRQPQSLDHSSVSLPSPEGENRSRFPNKVFSGI